MRAGEAGTGWSAGGEGWRAVVLGAQGATADAIAAAAGDGRLDRDRYQHWLAVESALCRLDALALESLSAWHAAQPPLQEAARAWAARLQDASRAAAADVRRIDVIAPALPRQLAPWQAFLDATCGTARAGEALGAVLLHAGLMRGPMRAAVAVVVALPFAAGHAYLRQRCQPECEQEALRQQRLLDTYSAAALAVGARRAADWYGALLADLLHAPCALADEGMNPARWQPPDATFAATTRQAPAGRSA